MIEILSYKEINKGAFLGSCNIKMIKWGGFIINKVCIFQKDGRRWVILPQETYEEGGVKKYFPLNKFDNRETNESFQLTLLQTLDDFILKNQQIKPQQQNEIPF